MSQTLRILVLEDVLQDAELAIASLEAAGYECVWDRVDSRTAFLQRLTEMQYDLVLSDYALPSFDGLSAVKLLNASAQDIPFILLSGTLGEEAAVEAMRSGVTDFLLKERLSKLPIVVARALQEKEEQRRSRRAEEQVALQAAALESAANAIVITDPQGLVTFVNPAFTTLTGYPAEEVVGSGLQLLKSGAHDNAFYANLWETITSGSVWQGELVNRRKDGTLYFEEQTITPVIGTSGKIVNFIGVKQDVSEKHKAEEALRESEERYRELVENAIDIIYTHDLEGNFLSVNKAVEKITGYTRSEALRMNLAATVAPEHVGLAREMIEAKLAGKEVTAYELVIIGKNGRRVAVEVNTRVLRKLGQPVAIQGIARDVTERKQLEEQFRQAQKMEAVGLLAGGIAHDFNNLLTAITGYSSLTLRKMADDDPLRRNVEEIKGAGDRAAALTGQLLAFSRKQVLKPSTLSLNKVVQEVDGLLRRITRENVELQFELDPHLGNVSADKAQMEQVLINLAINARDAMPDGGVLCVRTENVSANEVRSAGPVSSLPGAWARLSVSDTGEGMDAETQRRIFEPFFTTKAAGKGTGLGLAMVHGTITQSGGEISVSSSLGNGTVFEIYLPCIEQNLIHSVEARSAADSPNGSGTILLVEDEDTVRELVREFLTEFGYHVLKAADGVEAMGVVRGYSGRIHLLLTDVSMPRMNGAQLRDEVLRERPDTRVLFMSGFADEILKKSGGDTPIIDKPFTPVALAIKIREVLQG